MIKHEGAYEPFGFCKALSSLTGFAGQMLCVIPMGYLLGNGYRLYGPVIKRFSAPDDFSPFGEGGVNAYAYCEGDPVNRIDPSGHMFYLKRAPNGGAPRVVNYPGSLAPERNPKALRIHIPTYRVNAVRIYERSVTETEFTYQSVSLPGPIRPTYSQQPGSLSDIYGVEAQRLRAKALLAIKEGRRAFFRNPAKGAQRIAMAVDYLDLRYKWPRIKAVSEYQKEYSGPEAQTSLATVNSLLRDLTRSR